MKRFTDNSKWQDPWFRKLSGPAKLLWFYLTDQADPSGVVDLDYELASEDCRLKIGPEHLAELGNRVQVFAGTKVLIGKFIRFQYGKLSDQCLPHKRIFESIARHGLVEGDDGIWSHPDGTQAQNSGKASGGSKSDSSKPEKQELLPIPPGMPQPLSQALSDWKTHRKEIRKPLTSTQWEKLIEDCQKDPAKWTAVIRKSIISGWQGLFPEKITPGEIIEASPAQNAVPSWLPDNWKEIAVSIMGDEAKSFTDHTQIPTAHRYAFESACRSAA